MLKHGQDLHKSGPVLAKSWLKTCQDLRLYLRRSKSKKWHDQSSDTIMIQDMQFYLIGIG